MKTLALYPAKAIAIVAVLLLVNPVFADSPYDGIWELDTQTKEYYSLTVNGDNVILVSLPDVARLQDAEKGAYFGTASAGLAKMVNASFYVHLKKEASAGEYFFSWLILLSSSKEGIMSRPLGDYPGNIRLGDLPPLRFRKIF